MTGASVDETLAAVHRDEWGRIVAGLTRRFGDLDTAEESAAEAFAVAVERWPTDGIPPNPAGWLTTTATRKAIDRVRRESRREQKYQEAQVLHDDSGAQQTGVVEDDRLRLIFTCCHPALAAEARIALTLRMVGGLTVREIASAFLVQESAMARRITRSKAKIRANHVPYRIPTADDLGPRLDGVLTVLFLVFNEGYLATGSGTDAVRTELTAQAIRLTRLVAELLPENGEVVGLLALMLLTEARKAARVAPSGELVTLGEQDRSLWDRQMIAEGHDLVRGRLAAVATGAGPPGRFQLLAAINAVHTFAQRASDTDWSQIVTLYDRLARVDPSPVVALNRAVAVAEVDGPAVALALVDGLPLTEYHAFHATRADLLRRLGRPDDARDAYDRAIALTGNTAEAAYLTRRCDEL